MKQVLQSLSSGITSVVNVPAPRCSSRSLLIRTKLSLLSSGTERMLVDFGKANLFDKARQQPDKVKDVIYKASTDGVAATYEAVKSKLDQPLPLGYSNVGEVIAVGSDICGFKVGDRVVSNAAHAQIVSVPQNLCAHIPDQVSDESASFTVLGSIGLQGIRLASPVLGETFLVCGLGLIGLLTAQLLKANGCQVLGIDLDSDKCSLAQELGISVLDLSSGSDPVQWCLDLTDGIGVDGVLITASTSSTEPVHVAAKACRQRGRIILVGVTGLELRRDLFYKKELSFQVSCSYGPGRYDYSYEQEGHDYPIGFVRWTEQRNFQAVLSSIASKTLRTETLISHRFSIDDAAEAYQLLSSSRRSLGILLKYSDDNDSSIDTISLQSEPFPRPRSSHSSNSLISVIGAGNYAGRTLIPAFVSAGAALHSLAACNGIGPTHFGRKFRFQHATTDIPSLINSHDFNSLIIATRHDSHASLVVRALKAGKHVFVEKPLCLSSDELFEIESAYSGDQILTVGFNRRFAPLLQSLHRLLRPLNGPKAFVYTCNAGSIPADHWTQNPAIGGGRLLGEACHFVDLLRYLAACPIEDLQLINAADRKTCPDTFTLQLRFADGSIGTVHYFSNASKAYPKERLEVFADGKVLQLDNFRKLKAWGVSGFSTRRSLTQDKGQVSCCRAFLNATQFGGSSPIPVAEIFEVQRFLLQAVNR